MDKKLLADFAIRSGLGKVENDTIHIDENADQRSIEVFAFLIVDEIRLIFRDYRMTDNLKKIDEEIMKKFFPKG